jgi:hypothetical protein
MSDPLMSLLAALPAAEPDPARSARTKEQCRARLERAALRARGVTLDAERPRARSDRLWPAAIAALSAAYLADAIVLALGLYGRR